MFPKIAQIAFFIGVIGLPARADLPLVGGLLGGSGSGSAACPANQAVVSCGLLDVSLQCEQQCNDTQVCVNICTDLINTVSGVLSLLPLPVPLPAISTCMCQDGFYRNSAGSCVTLDLCAHTGVNLQNPLGTTTGCTSCLQSLPNSPFPKQPPENSIIQLPYTVIHNCSSTQYIVNCSCPETVDGCTLEMVDSQSNDVFWFQLAPGTSEVSPIITCTANCESCQVAVDPTICNPEKYPECVGGEVAGIACYYENF